MDLLVMENCFYDRQVRPRPLLMLFVLFSVFPTFTVSTYHPFTPEVLGSWRTASTTARRVPGALTALPTVQGYFCFYVLGIHAFPLGDHFEKSLPINVSISQ